MTTLLEKARTVRVGKRFSEEELELAIAWLNGQVSLTSVQMAVYGKTSTPHSAYIFLSRAIRQAVRDGIIEMRYV